MAKNEGGREARERGRDRYGAVPEAEGSKHAQRERREREKIISSNSIKQRVTEREKVRNKTLATKYCTPLTKVMDPSHSGKEIWTQTQ